MKQKSALKNPDESWVPFARIGRPHGLKGAFFLKTEDRRQTWPGYVQVLQQTKVGPVMRKILQTYTSGNALAVIFEGMNTREIVESMYDDQLFVHRDLLVAGEGEFIVHDLVGMTVSSESRGDLGKVVAVGNFGAQENLEIELKGTQKTILFPFVDSFIKIVDLEKRNIEIVYVVEFFDAE